MPPRTIIDCFFQNNPCYHVRITDDTVTLNKTFGLFKEITDFMIVSQEGGPGTDKSLHQHILLSSSSLFSEGKAQIKKLLLQQYPNARGNPGHQITKAKNKQVLASYVLKDGLYKFKGFTNEFIEDARKLSFSVNDFKKKYKDLQSALTLGQIDLEEYAVSLLRLKAKHHQPIYHNHFKAHLLQCMIDSDDNENSLTRAFVRNTLNSLEFNLSN